MRLFNITSTFPNFPMGNLESTLRANNANRIIWVRSPSAQGRGGLPKILSTNTVDFLVEVGWT